MKEEYPSDSLRDEDPNAYDLICGLQSDFPLCCILYYVSMNKHIDDIPRLSSLINIHILCPECMIMHFEENLPTKQSGAVFTKYELEIVEIGNT